MFRQVTHRVQQRGQVLDRVQAADEQERRHMRVDAKDKTIGRSRPSEALAVDAVGDDGESLGRDVTAKPGVAFDRARDADCQVTEPAGEGLGGEVPFLVALRGMDRGDYAASAHQRAGDAACDVGVHKGAVEYVRTETLEQPSQTDKDSDVPGALRSEWMDGYIALAQLISNGTGRCEAGDVNVEAGSGQAAGEVPRQQGDAADFQVGRKEADACGHGEATIAWPWAPDNSMYCILCNTYYVEQTMCSKISMRSEAWVLR